MSTSAQYASTPKFGSATLTTLDVSLTAPTVVSTVVTAGASGTRIDYINVQAVASTAGGFVNLFVFDGTTYALWQQVLVQPLTPLTTVPTFSAYLSSNGNANVMPLTLPAGYSLRTTTMVAQLGVRVTAYGGDF